MSKQVDYCMAVCGWLMLPGRRVQRNCANDIVHSYHCMSFAPRYVVCKGISVYTILSAIIWQHKVVIHIDYYCRHIVYICYFHSISTRRLFIWQTHRYICIRGHTSGAVNTAALLLRESVASALRPNCLLRCAFRQDFLLGNNAP
jgi:hypothetical protein